MANQTQTQIPSAGVQPGADTELTREDHAIVIRAQNHGHDAALVSMRMRDGDSRDAEIMARRTGVRDGQAAFIGRMRPAQREYWLNREQFQS